MIAVMTVMTVMFTLACQRSRLDVHVGMPTVQIGHVLKLLMAQCFVSHVVQGFVN